MTRQNPGSKLKEQGNRKRAKRKTSGGLEKERGSNDGDMESASGLNRALNNRRSQHDIFDIFREQLPPFAEVYRSIEFACVAARRGREWILISGKAVLSTEPCAPEAQMLREVELKDIVALKGRIPAEGYEKLVGDLRKSWAVRDPEGISVRLTAKGAHDYSWWRPKVIESRSHSKLWGRALALNGYDPDPTSLPSDSILEKIDRDLHSRTSPRDGFDGLCRELGLPARLSKPSSLLSFQVSAELPAWVTKVGFAEGTKGIYFNCLGTPDLKVKGWPRPVVERIPATSWDREPSNMACRAPLLYPHGADAADLILSFGELQADVATIELEPLYSDKYRDGELLYLPLTHQVLKDDEDICEHRKIQELVNGEAGSASAGPQKLTKARFEYLLSTLRSPVRKAILRVLYDGRADSDREVCRELDRRRVNLPTRWSISGQYRLFDDAYIKDSKIRQKIESEIHKMRELLSQWKAQAGR